MALFGQIANNTEIGQPDLLSKAGQLYSNMSIPAGNTLASALLGNPETEFTTKANIWKAGTPQVGGRLILRVGLVITTSIKMSLRLKVKLNHGTPNEVIVADSGMMDLLLKQDRIVTLIQIFANIWSVGANGQINIFGGADMYGAQGGLTGQGIDGIIPLNTTIDNVFSVTAQWGLLSTGGSVQLKYFQVLI